MFNIYRSRWSRDGGCERDAFKSKTNNSFPLVAGRYALSLGRPLGMQPVLAPYVAWRAEEERRSRL
jgi:hypothetical protein